MKAVISSFLLGAAAVASATNCDVSVLTEIANTADASTCKTTCNFVVPIESTESSRLADWESFCASDACQRVLRDLSTIHECSIDGASLHQSVVNRIEDDCAKLTRALRAADGSHVHSSGMDMGSASAEAEDSHEATSSSTASSEAEDSHDTTSASSGAEDSHDTTSSTSASAEAGGEDSHDHAGSPTSSSTGSSTTTSASKSSGSATGSKATSSNSTSSTQAPSASSTSSATSISITFGSVFLAAAAAFL
uniref:Elicitin-like protein n=1 Tax=Phytophthora ramorum TaxID=164328 RepID=H3GUD6_PHYRM